MMPWRQISSLSTIATARGRHAMRLDLGVDPPVAVLGVAVQCTFAGDDDVMHLGDVQQARKAVQRVALPAGEVVFVHFVLAGDDAGQDGVVGAVVVAQQHSALLEERVVQLFMKRLAVR